ncbi:outer membrane beta-barrel protein [Emticicia agri]|uniref:TonB-dependent receptor n=1 Tax=Emticicia agri TaxID=2492393 RepID=A0A4Q5LW96_9BACT|nr:outer membrane beta-barrel protein [Emticicia agri]RYU94046.1 TonB-dependent receptor [Emticicia agri]
MKKRLLLLAVLVHTVTLVFAQTPTKFNIKGIAIDSGNAVMPFATVMLLQPKDSTLVNFGRTDENGAFEFKNVKKANYILKISFVGYIPFQIDVKPVDGAVNDLGQLKLKPIAKELMEVVVKTARAPLNIKGDTIEYNAASFKVPPGSSVEDLLRKLPGVQIDQDGNIKAQGQDVKKVTVDGKSFFGNDPKAATKNLPADAITKIQIFNDKSEQAKATGVDDGKKEKTVNLELKDDFKKGGFGKVTAALGTDERAELKGNYNRFDTKQQFSVLGLGNNINQTGISRDDFQDFRGSQANNWGDEADFGFSSGVRFFYDNDTEESISIPVGGRNFQGFSENYAGGANYNYDTKKTKFSSNYYYNQTQQLVSKKSERENFLSNNNSFKTDEDSYQNRISRNHRVSLRFEQQIDSLNTLVLIGNGRMGDGTTKFNSLQEIYRNGSTTKSNQTTINNFNEFNSTAIALIGLYRHKFKKKGRNFAASVTYNYNISDGEASQSSVNELFGAPVGSIPANINQINFTNSPRNLVKSSLLFVEPLSKKFFSETFYNFSLRRDAVDRNVQTTDGIRIDSLSNYYNNDFMFNRFGTNVRYNHKGVNISFGLAAQHFHFDGNFARSKNATDVQHISRDIFAWIPASSINIDLKNNRYLWADYTKEVSEPAIKDLQPIIDNSNTLYIRVGNPNLLPMSTHRAFVGYNMFNPGSFTNMFFNLNYGYNINQVIYNQTVDPVTLVTTAMPTNISGGQNLGSYLGFGFPLKKTKSTLNLNAGTNISKNLIYINNVLNTTRNNNYNFGFRLDLTPSDKFTFYANGNFGITNTKYSINTTQNQQIFNHTLGAEMNIALPAGIYFSSNLNYRISKNERFGFNQHIPILYASMYKILGKAKKAEIRLSGYDLLKKNIGINQYAYQNFVSTEQTQTLSRYFMLSFTYNMRGVSAKMRRQGWF